MTLKMKTHLEGMDEEMKTPLEEMADAAVERLQKSRSENDSILIASGDEAGLKWARDDAEAVQLERLEKLDNAWYIGESPYTDAERLFFRINPENGGNPKAARAFWNACDDRFEDMTENEIYAFLKGFIEGSMSLWELIKGRI
jgi:hypothetical protein